MRLTCPNCAAQYEVDDQVIPRSGRDVQCSACGNTWYQYPKDVALEMRAAELDDDDDDEDETSTPAAASAAPRIDRTVLDVLREEADREMRERNRDRSGLESQGDLGLTRPARPRGDSAAPRAEDEAAPDPRSGRRNLLPDIEELTSTLEPGRDRRPADDERRDEGRANPSGFGRGFSTVLLIAMALIALYVLTPLMSAYVPAVGGVLRTYTSAIDGLRMMVAEMLRGLLTG